MILVPMQMCRLDRWPILCATCLFVVSHEPRIFRPLSCTSAASCCNFIQFCAKIIVFQLFILCFSSFPRKPEFRRIRVLSAWMDCVLQLYIASFTPNSLVLPHICFYILCKGSQLRLIEFFSSLGSFWRDSATVCVCFLHGGFQALTALDCIGLPQLKYASQFGQTRLRAHNSAYLINLALNQSTMDRVSAGADAAKKKVC